MIKRKKIYFSLNAQKEMNRFPKKVRREFRSVLDVLEKIGKLDHPIGKKLKGREKLFEIRIKYSGEWRAIYTYVNDYILILTCFRKKSNIIKKRWIKLAQRRLIES